MNGDDVVGREFTEAQMRRVLDRAMELEDGWQHTFSDADLREIAEELGISRGAVEAAIRGVREHTVATAVAETEQHHRERWWTKPVLGAALGIGVGFALPLLLWVGLSIRPTDPAGIPFVLGALFLLQVRAVLLAVNSHGDTKHERFQFANLALWCGFVLGWMGPFEAPWGGAPMPRYILEATVALGLITAFSGGIAIWLRDAAKTVRVGAGPVLRRGMSKVGNRVRQVVRWIESNFRAMRTARPRAATLRQTDQYLEDRNYA